MLQLHTSDVDLPGKLLLSVGCRKNNEFPTLGKLKYSTSHKHGLAIIISTAKIYKEVRILHLIDTTTNIIMTNIRPMRLYVMREKMTLWQNISTCKEDHILMYLSRESHNRWDSPGYHPSKNVITIFVDLHRIILLSLLFASHIFYAYAKGSMFLYKYTYIYISVTDTNRKYKHKNCCYKLSLEYIVIV